MDAQDLINRVRFIRLQYARRDANNRRLIAIRGGDYETVAPGLFNTSVFDKPLVANLIDTTARDIAEVMAPLPSVNCQAAALSNAADTDRQEKRSAVANHYVQVSRLQDQMYGGADRYGSFGFMAYIAEPDFKEKTPVIRVADTATAYYVQDYRGRVRQYFEVNYVSVNEVCGKFPDIENLETLIRNRYGNHDPNRMLETVRWYDDDGMGLYLVDPVVQLAYIPNRLSRCPIRVVERPDITDNVRGQYDDVIWVQIARALLQMYTMEAIEQNVHAPIVIPKDAGQIELGPYAAITTDQPNLVGRVNLAISNGLFPESSSLAQEQQIGSRYPGARTGNVDASIITGQGVQALMGTFDTQVQTFQRLNTSALEDVISICFEMDEVYWGNTKKTVRIKESGAPRTVTYTPSKDINGDYSVDVSYGAIAGLDPNRALVFILQALAGGLVSKYTAMKTLPVELNVVAEERQIQLEQMDASIAASIAALPQALPQMAMQGADPRDLVMQIAQLRDKIGKGESPADAIMEVFAAPEPQNPDDESAEPPSPLEQAQGAGQGPQGLPGVGSGGASDLLMSLAGLTPGGGPNLQSNVSRRAPAA